MTDLRKLADDMRALSEQVQALRDDITVLREDVDDLNIRGASPTAPVGSSPSPSGTPPRAHVWHTLRRSAAGSAWDQLAGWVDWLIERYRLEDTLPVCWYRHGAMVDELDALRAAWTAAYTTPGARPNDAAAWMALLAGALTRIREWDRHGCAAGTHRDSPGPAASAAGVDRLLWLQADIEARPATGVSRPETGGGDVPGDVSGDAQPVSCDGPQPTTGRSEA